MSTMDNISKNAAIQLWINDNVRSYPAPTAVTLSGFEVDWKKLMGSFRLSLDDELLDIRFGFAPDPEGSPVFSAPLVHSPLTEPPTMSTVNLTKQTNDAINNALQHSIPHVKSAGFFSSVLHRLKLSRKYSISMPVKHT